MAPTSASDSSADLPVSAPEVRTALAKVLASTGFVNSARLSKFVELAVEQTLAGQAERLKEFAIGQDVFDRGPDFDSRNDSIVTPESIETATR